MTCGSLTKSTPRISTEGLPSSQSYSRRVPRQNVAMVLFRRTPFSSGDRPRLDEVDDPSASSSVWMPRSRWSGRASSTRRGWSRSRSGSWRRRGPAPRSLPDGPVASSGCERGTSTSGRSDSHHPTTSDWWMLLSPGSVASARGLQEERHPPDQPGHVFGVGAQAEVPVPVRQARRSHHEGAAGAPRSTRGISEKWFGTRSTGPPRTPGRVTADRKYDTWRSRSPCAPWMYGRSGARASGGPARPRACRRLQRVDNPLARRWPAGRSDRYGGRRGRGRLGASRRLQSARHGGQRVTHAARAHSMLEAVGRPAGDVQRRGDSDRPARFGRHDDQVSGVVLGHQLCGVLECVRQVDDYDVAGRQLTGRRRHTGPEAGHEVEVGVDSPPARRARSRSGCGGRP